MFLHSIAHDGSSLFENDCCTGLGSIYGDHELNDTMDGAAIMKTFDTALWQHFERYAYVMHLYIYDVTSLVNWE